MSDVFSFSQGRSPLLVSVPHDGRCIPGDIEAVMTDAGRAIPDTDWHVARLYEFASDLGASVLVANYSRYVVDLNRPANDESLYPGQTTTGLCPTETFAGDNIYASGAGPDAGEIGHRVQTYWQPYHDCISAELARLKAQHGFAVLWDAHSIPGVVPRLFDGKLPALNIGTFEGRSCTRSLRRALVDAVGDYSWVVDGRFKGGYITRCYGNPSSDIHAVQLEIAQRTYMDETSLQYDESKACRLQETLRKMLAACTISHSSNGMEQ